MSTIAEVRQAIAASVDGVGGLRGLDRFPGQMPGPTAVVRRLSTSYSATFDGRQESRMAVTVYLPLQDWPTAQGELDALLTDTGAGSVIAALSVDPSFGGVVRASQILDVAEEGLVELDGVKFLSATVNLTVTNS